MTDWLRRRVIVLTMLTADGSRDWSSGSVNFGDCVTLWWRPLAGRRGYRRGILWRWWRVQVAASRNHAYIALTDHKTYLDVVAGLGH